MSPTGATGSLVLDRLFHFAGREHPDSRSRRESHAQACLFRTRRKAVKTVRFCLPTKAELFCRPPGISLPTIMLTEPGGAGQCFGDTSFRFLRISESDDPTPPAPPRAGDATETLPAAPSRLHGRKKRFSRTFGHLTRLPQTPAADTIPATSGSDHITHPPSGISRPSW